MSINELKGPKKMALTNAEKQQRKDKKALENGLIRKGLLVHESRLEEFEKIKVKLRKPKNNPPV